MSELSKHEFCRVCEKTSMIRKEAFSLTSNIALWVYFILGFFLVSRLRVLTPFENAASLITVIYISSIIIFAAYDSFIKTLSYRCHICGFENQLTREPVSRFIKLLIISALIFFAILLCLMAVFVVYIYWFY